ncbi:MAG: metallophosphoesterase [Saprospiraceae bacterium]
MRIALFSDIHGKILLPFLLCDQYQKATGKAIDLILQCGDLGAYPDLNNLDKATLKHAQYDRAELGFHDDFTTEKPQIKAFLTALNLDMICVRGNHEDHAYLNALEKKYPTESLFPIDIYRRVWLCKSGEAQRFERNGFVINFVGIGRIGDRKGRTDERFIQNYERQKIKALYKTKTHFDFLITHDGDDASQRGYGMAELQELLDKVIFHYHFYGHTGEAFKLELAPNGITQSCKIKELEFDLAGKLPPGCMLILEKKADEQFKLEIVPQSFTNPFTQQNWKYHLEN